MVIDNRMAILSAVDSLLKHSFLYYIATAPHHRFELILRSISLILTSLQILPSHTDCITAFADGTGKCSQPSVNTVPRKPNVSISNRASGGTGLLHSRPQTPKLRGNVGVSPANSEGSLPPVGSG